MRNWCARRAGELNEGGMDQHFSERLGKLLQLERSEDNSTGWLDVYTVKLAQGRAGYRVKMRKDPNNSKAQDLVKGAAVSTPREAAIRRAEFVAENPFPPKDPGRKVCCPMPYCLDPLTPNSFTSPLSCAFAEKAQEQRGRQHGEGTFFSSGLGARPQPGEALV